MVDEIIEEIKAADEKRVEKVAKRPPYVPQCYGPTKDCLKGIEDCAVKNCENCESDDCMVSPGQACRTKKDGTG